MESPDVGDREDHNCNISDDVWDGVANKECVIVNVAFGVYAPVPEALQRHALEAADENLRCHGSLAISPVSRMEEATGRL